jgi:hypothetical protein
MGHGMNTVTVENTVIVRDKATKKVKEKQSRLSLIRPLTAPCSCHSLEILDDSLGQLVQPATSRH